MKLEFPYQLTTSQVRFEQASGFPPFTRGYHIHKFQCSVTTNVFFNTEKKYSLIDFSSTAIAELFSKINTEKKILNKIIILEIPLKGFINTCVGTRVLRTILALFSLHNFNDAAFLKFTFISNISECESILTNTLIAQMAQIDYLLVNEKGLALWEALDTSFFNTIPIDTLYGNELLEKETDRLFMHSYQKSNEFLT